MRSHFACKRLADWNQKIIAKAQTWADTRTTKWPLEVDLYDVESAQIWGKRSTLNRSHCLFGPLTFSRSSSEQSPEQNDWFLRDMAGRLDGRDEAQSWNGGRRAIGLFYLRTYEKQNANPR